MRNVATSPTPLPLASRQRHNWGPAQAARFQFDLLKRCSRRTSASRRRPVAWAALALRQCLTSAQSRTSATVRDDYLAIVQQAHRRSKRLSHRHRRRARGRNA